MAGILVLLGITAYIVLQQEGELSRSSSAGEPLVSFDSSAVDKLEITANNSAVVLQREGGTWMVTSPVRYPADEAAVTKAVGQGRDMKVTAVVSTNPAKQSTFSVDSTGPLVKWFSNERLLAAVRIGKPTTSWTETYARIENSDDVCSVTGSLGIVYIKQPNDWRDKTIFKINQESVNEVKFQYGDTLFMLTRKDSVTWSVGNETATSGTVTSFLTSLSNFPADEFVDSPEPALQKPSATLEVNGTQLRFYKQDGKYLVRTSASSQVFSVYDWRANPVLKRKSEFLQ